MRKDWVGTVQNLSFIANASPTLMRAAMQGEPGKCFTLAETVTGINHLYVINGVELEIQPGNIIKCTWTCIPADTTAYWRIGTISHMGTETIVGPL
jgi:hypothetical protein